MSKIKNIKAIEILDSRGIPTVYAEVISDCGKLGYASVPSGASTGSHEAVEKRDDDNSRYFGKGVLNVIKIINENIAEKLIGKNPEKQKEIDEMLIEMDGTKNKKNFGANGILSISLACSRLAAEINEMPLYKYINQNLYNNEELSLPVPFVNILNGGKHADNTIDIQEFMIIPIFDSFSESIRASSEIFQNLKKGLRKTGHNTNVGDEGGVAPNINSTSEALDIITKSINETKYSLGKNVKFALDVAANEIFSNGIYSLEGNNFSTEEIIIFYENLTKKYPIISIEDPLAEDDWSGWKKITEKLREKVQLVGDDLFVTNNERLNRGINEKSANAILIKLNQIGTLTETLEVIKNAQKNNFNTIISHRSGETEDTFIADLAVAVHASAIKTGSTSRSERTAKYNRLIKIESDSFREIKMNKQISKI